MSTSNIMRFGVFSLSLGLLLSPSPFSRSHVLAPDPIKHTGKPREILVVRDDPATPPPPPPPPPQQPSPGPDFLFSDCSIQNALANAQRGSSEATIQTIVERAQDSTSPSQPNYEEYRSMSIEFVSRIIRTARGLVNSNGTPRTPVDSNRFIVQPGSGHRMDFQLLDLAGIEGSFALEYQDVMGSMMRWREALRQRDDLTTDGQVIFRWYLPQAVPTPTDPNQARDPFLSSGEAIAVLRISRTAGADAMAPRGNLPPVQLSLDSQMRAARSSIRRTIRGRLMPGMAPPAGKSIPKYPDYFPGGSDGTL